MLVTSIFSLSHNVFYPSQKEISIFFLFFLILSSTNAFNLDHSKILPSGRVNPLPDDKIIHWSKLEQTTDDILKMHLQ